MTQVDRFLLISCVLCRVSCVPENNIMVQVELAKIIIDEKNHEQAVVLREKGGPRQFPIVIGFVEASSIQMKVAGVDAPRPLTHDLFAAAILSLGARAELLVIDDLQEGTFYAKLKLWDKAGQPVILDCRPSDGISLAIRLDIPMFIEDKVFNKAVSGDI